MTELEKIINEWQTNKIKDIDDLDVKLSNYRILFAYNSNAIEGSTVSLHQTREIFENGKVINFTGDTREIFETQNQKNCYDWIKSHIINRTPITSDFIKDVHNKLTVGCYDEARWNKGERPGQYKINFYGTGLNVGVAPEDVAEEIDFICNELKDFSSSEPEKIIKAAAYFHCNFENIHAFADGNGRVGRTLMNYFLMINNMPPLVVFNEDKEQYYMALTLFDTSENLDGFVAFMKDQLIKTWANNTPGKNRKLNI